MHNIYIDYSLFWRKIKVWGLKPLIMGPLLCVIALLTPLFMAITVPAHLPQPPPMPPPRAPQQMREQV